MKGLSKYGLLIFFAFVALLLAGTGAMANDLGETPEIRFTDPEAQSLADKASQLGNAVAIYEFVRNEFAYSPYHGARSDAINTFGARRGNDIDQASVLIAMLRSRNIPARYVVGNVRLTAAQVKNWLGVENIDLAAKILTKIGIENVTLAADRTTLDFQHVWMETLVDYGSYRGVPGSQTPLDCASNRTQCQWIPLDPSFKQREPSASTIDIYNTVAFDYDAYYRAIANNDAAKVGKNPLEIYEDQIRATLPAGETLSGVRYLGPIINDRAGLLPASLPFQVLGNLRRYDAVDDHDNPAAGEPWEWAKYLKMKVDTAGHTFTSNRIRLTGFSTQRLSFHLRGGTPLRQGLVLGTTELMAVNLDGSVTDTETGAPVGINTPYTLTLNLDSGPSTTTGVTDTVEAVYDNLLFGGHVVIGTGGETSNQAQVQRAKDKLLQATKDYPVVFNPADPSVPYLDANGSGAYEAGTDFKLIQSETAMNALTGGLLETAVYSFYTQLSEKRSRLDDLQHTITPINGFVGVASSVYDVQYDNGSPFAVMPGGLVIDMKGLELLGSWRVDNDGTLLSNRTFELFGHIMSSLEHEVWQQLTGYDAISTVRGLQIAAANGVNIVEAVHNQAQDTGDAPFLSLGFQSTVPAPWLARQTTVFGKTLVTWYTNDGQAHAFEMLRGNLQPTDEDFKGNLLEFSTDNGIDNFVTAVDSKEEALKAAIAQYGASCTLIAPGYTFGGANHSGSCATVLSELGTYFRSVTEPTGSDPASVQNREYYGLIAVNQGFNPADAFYRALPKPADQHDGLILSEINKTLYHYDTAQQWTRYVIPARLTAGPNYAFSVYVRQMHDASDQLVRSTFNITNQVGSFGGGYVDSDNLLEQYVPSETPKPLTPDYLNLIFTDKQNVSVANNDAVRTPSTSDPVSTVTGNMYHDETDFIIKNRGIDYVLTRAYNSNVAQSATTPGPLGYGWTHSYNLYLTSKDTGACPNCTADPTNSNGVTSSIVFTDERGGDHAYLVQEGTLAITNPPGEFDTLILNTAAGQHQIRYRNGTVYTFENGTNLATTPGVVARLKSIADPYGNAINLTYNASGQLTKVRDNVGIATRTGLAFSYYASGRLAYVKDWTGRRVDFGYYSDNTLAIVQDQRGYQWTYNYKAGSRLLRTIAKPILRDGQAVYTEFDYYQNGKAYDYVNSLGHREALAYDLHRARTTVTGPRGFDTEHSYDPATGQLVKLVEPDGTVKGFANTADGLRRYKTDGLGFATQYSYLADRSFGSGASDNHGLVSRERDAAGFDTDYSYGANDQVTLVKDRRGNTVRRTYCTSTNATNRTAIGKLDQVFATVDGQEVLLEKYFWATNGNLLEKREYVQPGSTTAYRVTIYTYDTYNLYLTQVREGETSNGTFDRGYRDRYLEADALGRVVLDTVVRSLSPDDQLTGIEVGTYRAYDEQDRVIEERRGEYFYSSGVFVSESYDEWVYDGNGQLASERTTYINPSPDVTRTYATHTYDAADRRLSSTDVLGNTTTFAYDEAGNLLAQTDANGHTSRYEYDGMNRRTAIIDANGHRTEMQYDPAGRLIATKDANGNTTRYEYDALDRRTAIVSQGGRRTEFAYDQNGNQTGMIDANGTAGAQKNSHGYTEYRAYDERNRLRQIVDVNNAQTLYGYDLLGRLLSITDAKGQITTMVYDYQGNVERVVDPVHESSTDKVASFVYDQVGNRIIAIDRDGREQRSFYDSYNRLSRIDHHAGGVVGAQDVNGYDDFGNLSASGIWGRNPDGTYSLTSRYLMTHTARRELNTLTELHGHSLTYGYDAVGNVAEKTDYQGQVTSFQYDSANRLVAERNPHFLQVSYYYDGAGRLMNRILSNGAQTAYRYDADNRLTALKNLSADGTEVEDRTYQRDATGNITQDADAVSGRSVHYAYDPLYRLATVDSTDNSEDRVYSYDAVGNRLTETKNGTTYHYTYSAGNRLTEIHTGSPTGPLFRRYSYADSGRVLDKRGGDNSLIYSLTYDARGRVAGTGTPTTSATYLYDIADYRIQKTAGGATSRYLHEGEHVEAIYDGSDYLKWEYFRGVVVDEIVNGYNHHSADANDWTNYTFHHDHVNSVTALTGHAGTVEQTWSYDAFGKPLTTANPGTGTGNDLLYTGREYDDKTGLYYYRSRYYDPEIGRFLSEDPLGFKAGVNFYSYCKNNPINANDPMGLWNVNFNYTGGPGWGGTIGVQISQDGLYAYAGGGASTGSGASITIETSNPSPGVEVYTAYSGGNGVVGGILESQGQLLPERNASGNFGIGWGVGLGMSSGIKVTTPIVEWGNSTTSSTNNTPASGGFVLYPNKPNTNMMNLVYNK